MPDQDQEQEQEQAQAELQAQLQAQLQGQGQGQGQGQAQGQLQFALNANENENENSNESENSNSNSNENELSNEVESELDNEVDNAVANELENEVENSIENTIENNVETNVDVDVSVDLDLDIDDLAKDNDVIDIDEIEDIEGSIVMPDAVSQHLEGNGNQINIDQVNNLVDNDWLDSPEVSFEGGEFEMHAEAEGGSVEVGDPELSIEANGATLHDTLTSTADATVTQSAFTQNIVMGANIQFNSITANVAGNDLTDDHSI
jgi:hypothetical protein